MEGRAARVPVIRALARFLQFRIETVVQGRIGTARTANMAANLAPVSVSLGSVVVKLSHMPGPHRMLTRPEDWIAYQRTVVDGIPVAVAELTGKASDVVFCHPWLLHSISPNCSQVPRLMCTQRIHRLRTPDLGGK